MKKALLFTILLGAASAEGQSVPPGFDKVYGKIPADQVEFISTGERIKSVASSGSPMAIWEALEHGEKVECLDCIPSVERLLYDANASTREIAAWWLRRRILGVFGPGEAYQRTVNTLKSDPDPRKRAFAAQALGEFLAAPGIDACATALSRDTDPGVRAAAAQALGRLNDDGKGALGKALADGDARVKLAALDAARKINSFTQVAEVSALLGDGDPLVRRRAVGLLDLMRAKDAVASVIALAKNDADADVRIAAVHALGSFGDAAAKPTLLTLAESDPNGFVRDQARVALRRL
jgi:HEAT repeat protein